MTTLLTDMGPTRPYRTIPKEILKSHEAMCEELPARRGQEYCTATMRILLIEDDKQAARWLSKGLQEERFVVDVAYTGEAGDEMASVNDYDVIVLDWVLPDKDGIAVCRDLRARGVSTPILMLTARDALEDRVTGLYTGADDYLTNPFEFSELLA